MKKTSPFKTLSKVKPRKVEWFWKYIIPYGMLTIMEGDPGQGKSYLAMYLASLVSTGSALPDGSTVEQGYVTYISSEDDPSYTIRPRIDAMGGDPEFIRILNGDLTFSEEGLETLRQELEEHPPQIIFIDPWVSFVPSDRKITDSNAIRSLLTKMREIAEDYGCAIVLIRHLTKLKQDNALYQGGGAVDIIAAARSALRIGSDPNDTDVRIIAHFKHNVGPRSKSWAYRLVTFDDDGIPEIKFVGESEVDIEDLSAPTETAKPKDAAQEFLKKQLKDGQRRATEIKDLAAQLNISSRTLERAKSSLKINSKQTKRGWFWSLPEHK